MLLFSSWLFKIHSFNLIGGGAPQVIPRPCRRTYRVNSQVTYLETRRGGFEPPDPNIRIAFLAGRYIKPSSVIAAQEIGYVRLGLLFLTPNEACKPLHFVPAKPDVGAAPTSPVWKTGVITVLLIRQVSRHFKSYGLT